MVLNSPFSKVNTESLYVLTAIHNKINITTTDINILTMISQTCNSVDWARTNNSKGAKKV